MSGYRDQGEEPTAFELERPAAQTFDTDIRPVNPFGHGGAEECGDATGHLCADCRARMSPEALSVVREWAQGVVGIDLLRGVWGLSQAGVRPWVLDAAEARR